MILETIEVGGCRSYILGCPKTHVSAVIDPEISAIERYRGLAARHGLTLRYAIDTHTHADHFSAAREIGKALAHLAELGKVDAPLPERVADELRWDGTDRDTWEAFCARWELPGLRRRPHRWREA